jgi:hypothetical protein
VRVLAKAHGARGLLHERDALRRRLSRNLKLATRRKTFAVLGLHHLLQMRDRDEVTLLGHELRSLLVLASKAHPRERRAQISRCASCAGRGQASERVKNESPRGGPINYVSLTK